MRGRWKGYAAHVGAGCASGTLRGRPRGRSDSTQRSHPSFRIALDSRNTRRNSFSTSESRRPKFSLTISLPAIRRAARSSSWERSRLEGKRDSAAGGIISRTARTVTALTAAPRSPDPASLESKQRAGLRSRRSGWPTGPPRLRTACPSIGGFARDLYRSSRVERSPTSLLGETSFGGSRRLPRFRKRCRRSVLGDCERVNRSRRS